MNPLLQKWAGTLIRGALMLTVGTWAAENNVWTDGEAEEYIAAFVGVLIPLLWSVYEKWQSARKQNTTLAVMNQLTGPGVANLTDSDIKAVIQRGDAAPAVTASTDAPILRGSGEGMRRLKDATARF